MSFDIVPLHPLERGQLGVMRTRSAITATMLFAAAGVADFAWQSNGGPPGLIAGPVALFGLWLVFVSAPSRWRRWGWAFTGTELHVAHGWLTHVHTIVPVRRVQHIDLSQGPIERRHRVATLVLHTAGTEHSEVVLPGLSREEAERIRDAIRAGVAQSPK